MSLVWFFFSSVLGTRHRLLSGTTQPTHSPTFSLPSKSPTADPTCQPTYEWGPWGDCIDCGTAANVPSRYRLPRKVCGCRESSRTCEEAFADYDCTSSGVEVRVDSCDVDGLAQEITCVPTERPTYNPSKNPSKVPTVAPTDIPSFWPSFVPTVTPTNNPTTLSPTINPTSSPTPNTEGEVVLDVGIIFHGWPSSKIVTDTLFPFSRVIEVDAEVIDIISSNYTKSSPYTMSVQYELYLMTNDDVEDVARIIDTPFFGTYLSENILDSWDKPSLSLTVSKAYHSFMEPKRDSQKNEWAIALLTFGCSVILTMALVGVLTCLRRYFKRQFHKGAQEYGALLNQRKEDLTGYQLGLVELRDTTKSDDLQQQPTVEDSENPAFPSPPDSGEFQILSPLYKTRSIVETFSEVMDLEQQKPGAVLAVRPSTSGESRLNRRKSELIRHDHHQFRKQVLRRINSTPIKVSHTLTEAKGIWGFGPSDEEGNVKAPIGNSGDLKKVDSVDTQVKLEELGSRTEGLKQSSLKFYEENQGKSRAV